MKPIFKSEVMNKDESRYAENLRIKKQAKAILDFFFQDVKVRLADKTYYTPDFFVAYPGHFEVVEIKGFLRDDAAVKFKIAAEKFWFWKWRMIRWNKDHWDTIYEK